MRARRLPFRPTKLGHKPLVQTRYVVRVPDDQGEAPDDLPLRVHEIQCRAGTTWPPWL
jgi:hypothetical protein